MTSFFIMTDSMKTLASVLGPSCVIISNYIASSLEKPHVYVVESFDPSVRNFLTMQGFKTRALAEEFAELQRTLGSTANVCSMLVNSDKDTTERFKSAGKDRIKKEPTAKRKTAEDEKKPKKRVKKEKELCI